MARQETKVGIIGLGLIGGSVALKLRNAGFAGRIYGTDNNREHVSSALRLGIIDEFYDLPDLCQKTEVIVLAIPVNHALNLLPTIMKQIGPESVLIDFGSTKSKICQMADQLANREQFVACHPIAGTENTGPEAAFSALFENKVNIICDAHKSSATALKLAEALINALGMRAKYMNSDAHDRHIAYVSHMSHISSFILGQTVLEVEKDEKNIFDMAGSGFASTVRLAKSSPEMWAPIFTENSTNILKVLDHYIKNLNNFRSLIVSEDETGLKKTMTDTNIIREVLEGEHR